jgi:hypothetical protein
MFFSNVAWGCSNLHFQRTSETDEGIVLKLALTQQSVEKIVPDISIKEYREVRLKGFLLRVTPNGSKSYYCELGRGQRIFIGCADALGLSEAREAARTYLADHFKGDDPRIKRAANARLPRPV